MLNASRPSRAPLAGKLFLLAALTGAFVSASACSSDSSPGNTDGGSGGGSETGGTSGSGNAGGSGNSGTGAKAGAGGSSGTGGSGAAGAGGGTIDTEGGTCSGAPSKGTNDATHCKAEDGGALKQATGACVSDTADAGPGPTDAGGGSADGGGEEPDYGTTLYGTEGDDDDCKYHVKYTVAPICEKEGTNFEVTVTNTADGKPTTGAYPYIEATLNDFPASVPDAQTYKEKSGGVYDIGPIVFDKPGKWVVRLHFFENCSDEPEDSPHGHIAFYMDIP